MNEPPLQRRPADAAAGSSRSGPAAALAHLHRVLTARFDAAVLRAPHWNTPAPAVASHAVARLRAWCLDGSGSGATPLWSPAARPDLPLPCKVAAVRGAAATDAVLALGLTLDGSLRLQARPGRAAAMLLRLRVKAGDAMWWRRRRDDDPWDFGYLAAGADAAALARFTPRRATLVVAEGDDRAQLHAVVAALQACCAGTRHLVRLLLTGCQPDGVEAIVLP